MTRIEARRSKNVAQRPQPVATVRQIAAALGLVLGAGLIHPAAAGPPDAPVWLRQLGSSGYDYAEGVAVDVDGNIVISGRTDGSFRGSNQGGYDAWVAKYDRAGHLLWKQQLGSDEYDDSRGVAVDAAGNAFMSGSTNGLLSASYNYGVSAWVAKYGAHGSLLWVRQLDTGDYNWSEGVVTDASGNVFIGGTAYVNNWDDALLVKYDANGDLLWTRQLGGPLDVDGATGGVATDRHGNAFISGVTGGSLGPRNRGLQDAFVAKYDTDGNLLWVQQLGSSENERAQATATDGSGNVLIAGWTEGALAGPHRGGSDAFVAKYGAGGKLLWKRQLGTRAYDMAEGVAADGDGNVFVAGGTTGALGGRNRRSQDPWVAKYGADGTLLWKLQFGSYNEDWATGLAVDGKGDLIVAGSTWGVLPGPRRGRYDAFVAKFGGD